MRREKNPLKCRKCRDELPLYNNSGVCNFCANQSRAKRATLYARMGATLARQTKEPMKK